MFCIFGIYINTDNLVTTLTVNQRKYVMKRKWIIQLKDSGLHYFPIILNKSYLRINGTRLGEKAGVFLDFSFYYFSA